MSGCIYLWKLYDALAKEKKASSFFFAKSAAASMPGQIWRSWAKSASGSRRQPGPRRPGDPIWGAPCRGAYVMRCWTARWPRT